MPTKRDRREYWREYRKTHPYQPREPVWTTCGLQGCGKAVTGTVRRQYCTPAHRAAAARERNKR